LVINQTEALVAIDVNSGRATKERNVEATAFKTNCEAAVEAARQLRLRDLAGLVVIDFIDMDESKNNRTVERILKDELSFDRARIQMGRISGFGLMEISRQRRRLGVLEGATEVCPHCQGAGRVRSAESAALMVLRAVDIEAGKNGAGSINLKVSSAVALYILNHKRDYLQRLLERRGLAVIIQIDDRLGQGESAIERTETNEDFTAPEAVMSMADLNDDFDDSAYDDEEDSDDDEFIAADDDEDALDREDADDDEPRERAERTERVDGERGRGRGRSRRRGGRRDEEAAAPVAADTETEALADDDDSEAGRRRRRGRRGGRRIREEGDTPAAGAGSFFWVRGRTPSLDDPYVWFDPINPAPRAERPAQAAPNDAVVADDVEERIGERPEGELSGDREGGRSRRRRRGRGRGERATPHDLKVEGRATNEGMPADGSPDTPMAVILPEEASEAAAPVIAPEPQRRRVRRKTAASAVEADVAAEPIEAVAPPLEPEVAFVEAAAEPISAPEPEALVEPEPLAPEPQTVPAESLVVAEDVAPPTPEADLSAIIANDPAQITAPPVKPKRGWWRL
ncbi:MAG: ribonuclease E/G, partial [Pseudomonadota bacterium]